MYIKLEKLVQAKSRSIDLNKNRGIAVKKGKAIHYRKDFQSEDKDKNNFNLNDKKPVNHKKKVLNYAKNNLKGQQNNKYFKYLQNKLKKNKLTQELIKDNKKRFRKWKAGELAEFFNFKTNIGYYKIIQQIGKGCFGKVYLAMQILTQNYVALKVIPKTSIKSKNSMKKIKREVKILKVVNNHEGIIKLLEVFEDENYVYMVFEFVEKGDLVHYFKKNPLLEENQLKEFFAKILKAVSYLHKNKILHRDIKLDNILLDRNLNPKICDFGISSEYDERKKIFDTGGTPAYLAPEVIKSEGEICPKSDVWSLGVLLYLLSFGVVPFKANDMQVLYNKIIIGKYKFPDNNYISSELRDLLSKMLVVDVKKRYSIEDIFNHSWMREVKNIAKPVEKTKKKNLTKKEKEKMIAIDLFMANIGFNQEFLEQSIKKNLFNHIKACRDSLYFKFNIPHLGQFLINPVQ